MCGYHIAIVSLLQSTENGVGCGTPENPREHLPASTRAMPQMPRKKPHLAAGRLDDRQLAALNAWRRKQEDPPTHAEAIRRLMELGLAIDDEVGVRLGKK